MFVFCRIHFCFELISVLQYRPLCIIFTQKWKTACLKILMIVFRVYYKTVRNNHSREIYNFFACYALKCSLEKRNRFFSTFSKCTDTVFLILSLLIIWLLLFQSWHITIITKIMKIGYSKYLCRYIEFKGFDKLKRLGIFKFYVLFLKSTRTIYKLK